jgi:hypothetical protein
MAYVFNPFTGHFDALSDPIEDAFTFDADCSTAEAVGDCVYVSAEAVAGIVQVRKAVVADTTKMPAIGIILEKPSTVTAVVAYLGSFPVGALPAFLPGKRYFVGASSQPVSTPPTAPALIQVVGVALDSGRLLFNPSPVMIRTT